MATAALTIVHRKEGQRKDNPERSTEFAAAARKQKSVSTNLMWIPGAFLSSFSFFYPAIVNIEFSACMYPTYTRTCHLSQLKKK